MSELPVTSIRLVRAVIAIACLALFVTGCTYSTPLNATPNLYQDGRGRAVFDDVPQALRTPDMPLIYVTDRAITGKNDAGPEYGLGRSLDIAYGMATVALQPPPTWEELVQDSTQVKRSHNYTLHTTRITPVGEFKPLSERVEIKDGHFVVSSKGAEEIAAEKRQFQKLLEERLALSPHKDVYILVHGVNNTFDDVLFRASNIWHFIGRRGVIIAYAWPAGASGLRGYFADRESGEFTVPHLETLLQTVAECPGVERVHLIAHSRGTDVATTAIRELAIAYMARGQDTAKALKLQTFILASPDLDAEVFRQRFIFETLGAAQDHLVIYFSPDDDLIKVSKWLFSSKVRVGGLTVEDFSPQARERLNALGTIDFVHCDISGFSTSHDYEFAHPAVMSDMILVLRDNDAPGAAHGRPLKSPAQGLWEITNDYALPARENAGKK